MRCTTSAFLLCALVAANAHVFFEDFSEKNFAKKWTQASSSHGHSFALISDTLTKCPHGKNLLRCKSLDEKHCNTAHVLRNMRTVLNKKGTVVVQWRAALKGLAPITRAQVSTREDTLVGTHYDPFKFNHPPNNAFRLEIGKPSSDKHMVSLHTCGVGRLIMETPESIQNEDFHTYSVVFDLNEAKPSVDLFVDWEQVGTSHTIDKQNRCFDDLFGAIEIIVFYEGHIAYPGVVTQHVLVTDSVTEAKEIHDRDDCKEGQQRPPRDEL